MIPSTENRHGIAPFYENQKIRRGSGVLEGVSVYDDSIQGPRPGVLVVHQWKGLGDYEKKRAEMLARLGYNVFAVDIYGKGVRPISVNLTIH
jgi:dienelactone hydrolase